MVFKIEFEQEEDGRWLAEVLGMPGVLAIRANQAGSDCQSASTGVTRVSGSTGTRRDGSQSPERFVCSSMSQWRSAKARRVLAALLRIGWEVKRTTGSHRILARASWADTVFAFHDGEEIGPKMLARIAKATGLKPEDI